MNLLRSTIKIGMHAQRAAGALCLIVLVTVITGSVILRYVFNRPLEWTEELIGFVFIWLSFLGAAVVAAKRRHVAVDFITDYFPPAVKFWVQFFIYVLVMLLLAVMFVSTVLLIPTMRHVTVTLEIPRYWYNIPILISSIFMLLVYVEDMIVLFRPDLKAEEYDSKNVSTL